MCGGTGRVGSAVASLLLSSCHWPRSLLRYGGRVTEKRCRAPAFVIVVKVPHVIGGIRRLSTTLTRLSMYNPKKYTLKQLSLCPVRGRGSR